MQKECMIEFENVKKSYGEKVIIPCLNLCIPKGAFVTVIGSSGSGKTTFLKMMNGLVLPDEGKIYVGGRDLQSENMTEFRRNTGYAIQGNILFPHMTVAKNIAYVPNLLNKKDKNRTQKAVKKWMDIMNLPEDLAGRYPDELSGGQQQRVGIARSLAASPYILLMDEPFGAVDEITRKGLQDELKRIHAREEVTVVFITHDIGEALHLGTHVLVMEAGDVLQFAPPEEILSHPANDFVRELCGQVLL